MNYKAVIVEDEKLTRLSLIGKLEKFHPDVEIIDSCFDSESALESIYKNRPDIVFLDIQLPGENSIWLLEQLESLMPLPYIIFTTAFTSEEYLLRAIKFSAVDYLIKPVDIAELSHALDKIRALKPLNGNKRSYNFRSASGVLILSADDIIYCLSDGECSVMYLNNGEETVLERLGKIEERLDKTHFLRCGRGIIVNKKYLYKIDAKRNICLLKSASGEIHKVKIPESGIDGIRKEILS